MNDTPKKPRGRPRTRPEGVRERGVYLTDAEYREVQRAADANGISIAKWMRDRIVSGIPHKKSNSRNATN